MDVSGKSVLLSEGEEKCNYCPWWLSVCGALRVVAAAVSEPGAGLGANLHAGDRTVEGK